MIKPVTYQGVFNFAANLYAIEVRSRFIDQRNANGYYKGYGNELAASVVGQQIQIGTGAFVVQGRMNEVVSPEILAPQIFDGFVGYIVARVETYHPSDDDNCTFVAYVNRTFEALDAALKKDDINAPDADNVNRVYELPIYSFAINGTAITNLQKLIGAVDDYAKVKQIVDDALSTAQAALTSAGNAVETANGAVETANTANGKADNAVSVANAANAQSAAAVKTANDANTTSQAAERKADNAVSVANGIDGKAQNALDTANAATETVAEQHEAMTAEIDALQKAIVEKQGSVVMVDGVAVAVYDTSNNVETTDEIIITGGGV